MTIPDAPDVVRLRQRFAAAFRAGVPRDDCPDADQLWCAARGESDRTETIRLIDHVSACPLCAEAWSIAMRTADRPERPRSWFRPTQWAAAAVLILLVGGLSAYRLLPFRHDASGLRGEDAFVIESTTPDGSLSRAECLLRWSEGPESTRYSIVVTDAELAPMTRASGLEDAEFVVPRQALEPLEPGATLLWRVEATLPDGSVVSSPTFSATVE